jgi:hypothetical protein
LAWKVEEEASFRVSMPCFEKERAGTEIPARLPKVPEGAGGFN